MKALQLLHILVITLTACSGLPQRQGYFANNPGYASGGPWHRRQTAPVAPISTLENIFKNFLASAFPQSPANRQLAAASALIPIVAAGATATAAITTTVAVDQSNQRAAKEKEVQEKNTMLSNLDTNLKTREKEVTDLKKAMTTADTKSKADLAAKTNKDSKCKPEVASALIDTCKPGYLGVCTGSLDAKKYIQGTEECTDKTKSEKVNCVSLLKPLSIVTGGSKLECDTDKGNAQVPFCSDDLTTNALKASDKKYLCAAAAANRPCYSATDDSAGKTKKCKSGHEAAACKDGGNPTNNCNGLEVAKCVASAGDASDAPTNGKCSDTSGNIATVCSIATMYPDAAGVCKE